MAHEEPHSLALAKPVTLCLEQWLLVAGKGLVSTLPAQIGAPGGWRPTWGVSLCILQSFVR